MNITDRLSLALNSQIGTVFICLALLLIFLGIFYLILSYRRRNKDILVHLHEAHYRKALDLPKPFDFVGSPKADFFGRQSIVKFKDGNLGLCVISPPEMTDSGILARFRQFDRAVQPKALPLAAPHLWKNDKEVLMIVQGNLLEKEGRCLLNIRHYLKDHRLRETDKERVLLEIARALSSLHSLHTENGETLYYGYLMAGSVFLGFDSSKSLNRIVLSDMGIPFSIGSQKLHQRLMALKEGKLPMEKFRAQEILEQMAMLAPEQRDPNRLSQVGAASDFYSFGCIAIYLFTEKLSSDQKTIRWDKVPSKWHPFLKACLENEIQKRPHSFSELEDWLSDPELALTHQESEGHDFDRITSHVAPIAGNIEDLPNLLSRIRMNSRAEAASDTTLSSSMEVGLKASKGAKWDIAKKSFKEAIKAQPDNAEAHVHYAIACYELGELKAAEQHYGLAKKQNPRIAKKFRDHIALNI